MGKLLDKIEKAGDIKQVKLEDLPLLCSEIRVFLIETILANGGHFAANLGVVELTVALHYLLNLPNDALVWDVGHQSYTHKLLTGRKKDLKNIRKTGGISGFPRREESIFDTFGTGHSSTSISAALGMAMGPDKEGKKHIAVIGDGALTAGQAFEGLNNMAISNADILVVINDNQMSIDPNNGAIAAILNDRQKAKTFFETFGLSYQFCSDGNDFNEVFNALTESIKSKTPRILHIKTVKGFGYKKAEEDHIRWHATESMVKVLPNFMQNTKFPKYQEVVGKTLVQLGKLNTKINVVTPAMPTGSGLKEFEALFPSRFFDVGIAEQHAVTFCGGLAIAGAVPFCVIYSTFLQRAYDQIIHDICMQNIAVIFLIDRAGIVGGDGQTHHGVFDIAYLKCVPNLTIIAPPDIRYLRNAIYTASIANIGPIAIRYPRGRGEYDIWELPFEKIDFNKNVVHQIGKQCLFLNIGDMLPSIRELLPEIDEKIGPVAVESLVCLKPLDHIYLNQLFSSYEKIIIIENGAKNGGIGESIARFAKEGNYKVRIKIFGFEDNFIPHGDNTALFENAGLRGIKFSNAVKSFLEI